MIDKPSNWDSISSSVTSRLETRIRISPGTTPRSDVYVDLTGGNLESDCFIEAGVLEGSGIGNVCSTRLTFTTSGVGDMPEGFRVGDACVVYIRMAIPGGQSTNWLYRGTFYIFEVVQKDNGNWTVTAYDGLYMFGDVEVPVPDYSYGVIGNTSSLQALLSRWLSASPWGTDSRIQAMQSTNFFKAELFGKSDSPTKRDMLQYTAILAGSNIAINYLEKAYFVEVGNGFSITETPSGIVTPYTQLKIEKRSLPINAVNLTIGETISKSDNGYAAETELPEYFSGRTSSGIASNMRKVVQPVTGNVIADAIFCSPLLELGDMVSFETDDGYINARVQEYKISLLGDCSGYIASGLKEEQVTLNTDSESASTTWVELSAYAPSSTEILGQGVLKFKMIKFGNVVYKPSNSTIRLAKITDQVIRNKAITCADENGNTTTISISMCIIGSSDTSNVHYVPVRADTTGDYYYLENIIGYVSADLSQYSSVVSTTINPFSGTNIAYGILES